MPDYKDGYREGYAAGFRLGYETGTGERQGPLAPEQERRIHREALMARPKKRRKLSAWNKFVKANSKKPRFIYRNGKLNLKKMAVAFRKTPAGKKRKR